MEFEDRLDEILKASVEKQRLSNEFCQKHKKQLEKIESKINRNVHHLLKLSEDPHSTDKICSLDCLQLIDRAIKLNATCLDLIRQLNFVEAAIISRSLIELCTTAIAINKDTKMSESFSSNKNFDSTKTISIANKYIPGVGKVWGNLSNYIIHINPSSHGAKRYYNDDGEHAMTGFQFTCLHTTIPETDMLFDQIELMTYLILYTLEVVCFYKVTYKDIKGYAFPNKTSILIGDSGEESFKKYYNKIYNHAE